MMGKPTAAGMRVLNSFGRRPDDDFEYNSMKLWRIQNRSGLRSVNAYLVVEKLEADGFLSSKYGFDGTYWSLTEAGKAAIEANT